MLLIVFTIISIFYNTDIDKHFETYYIKSESVELYYNNNIELYTGYTVSNTNSEYYTYNEYNTDSEPYCIYDKFSTIIEPKNTKPSAPQDI
jgi:hypothetical protein